MAVLLLKSIHRPVSDGYVQEKTVMLLSKKNTSSTWFPVEGAEGVYKVALNLCGKIVSRRWGYVSLGAIYTMEISLRESSCGKAVGKHDVLLKESAADICLSWQVSLKSLKDLLTVSLYGNKAESSRRTI